MPDPNGFKLDIDFPWEDVLTQGLTLLREQLAGRPARERQYFSFWWTRDLWAVRKETLGAEAAGPEPKFEDFVPPAPPESLSATCENRRAAVNSQERGWVDVVQPG